MKRLAVSPAGANQLDDPAGASPALTDGACGIASSELPPHMAAMAGPENANHHWTVPVSAELGDDLLIQTVLVILGH
jgi:hypothetical protein